MVVISVNLDLLLLLLLLLSWHGGDFFGGQEKPITEGWQVPGIAGHMVEWGVD